MPEAGIRLDKFLWCARIVKTRGLARQMVEQGVVRLNRARIAKPGHDIHIGDVLTFVWSERLHVWRVRALPKRRGTALEARLLYDEISAPTESTS
jgi:ribosome-associated heat shock protein Hsp15